MRKKKEISKPADKKGENNAIEELKKKLEHQNKALNKIIKTYKK